jgi:hypothetical protein
MTDKSDEPHDPRDMSHPDYDSAKDPTSPFYEGNKADAGQKPDEDSHKVGPGYPPNEHKWKKGCRSPHPMGRPKKIPSMKPDLKKALEAALNEKVVVTKDKKEVVLTKASLGIEQLVNQFAKGDRYARRDLFQYATLLGVDLHAKDLITEALGINEQAIVDAFLQREKLPSAEAAPEDHVKAPPDLIDDDVTKSEPNDAPAASPKQGPPAKKPPAPPVGTHAYIAWLREQNLAQQKKNQGES